MADNQQKAEDLKGIYMAKPEGFGPNGAFEFTPLLVKAQVHGLNPEQIIDVKKKHSKEIHQTTFLESEE